MVKKNNKVLIGLFVAIFVLPVVLAKLALEQHWFTEAVTNKGELLQPVLDMSGISQGETQTKWKLLYVLPEKCDVACKNALYSLNQIWLALGKESDRVAAVVVSVAESDAVALEELKNSPTLQLLATDKQSVNQVFKDVATNGIFIADTLNNVILRYPTQNDSEQAVLHSRDILSDMRKVLKLSRIG
ncbi:MAG: hypothetical protein GW763_17290 [Paraglaciecola sp.]|nr:hypothetical protein [Paraglaciecola sp.]NCT49708.1 hypothetical protein [Paraglaciecola sp.]